MPTKSTNINDKSASEHIKLENRKMNSQISSITNFMSKMNSDTNRNIKSMDKRINNILKYQSKTKKQTEYAFKSSSASMTANRELARNTSYILKSVNNSINQLAIGTKKVTTTTALSAKEMMSQYSKAINEDLNINKQNVIAMSLARATPLFGYFAAKFMETNVFKDTFSNIKIGLSDALSSVFMSGKHMMRTFGGKLKDMFIRSPKIEYSEKSKRYLGDISVAKKIYMKRLEK